jgi:hypothetical protein
MQVESWTSLALAHHAHSSLHLPTEANAIKFFELTSTKLIQRPPAPGAVSL